MRHHCPKRSTDRAQLNVSDYRGLEPVSIPLEDWRSRWLPGLPRDGLLVGLNWSGVDATGYDISPDDVTHNLEIRLPR